MKEKLQETILFLEEKGFQKPEIGIVLGTGFGKFTAELENPISINYSDIPNFVESTVEFHSGKLYYGKLNGKSILMMQGRFHQYEGYNYQQITFPIRVMQGLGIQYLFLSNAAGGINLDFQKGDLMIIEDHINLQTGSPLAFKNVSDFGDRFTDMYEPYDVALREKCKASSIALNIETKTGVYACVSGPQLETKAEYRYLKIIGADAVGMSTVPEVIVANHLKLPCLAVSVLTDECNPANLKPINIPEIIATAENAEPKLIQIFKHLLSNL